MPDSGKNHGERREADPKFHRQHPKTGKPESVQKL